MCRFLVYKGKDPILLSNLILEPAHSILTQSYDTRLRKDLGRNNGDGFGIGYYALPSLVKLLGPQPCIFTSTIPAWNCANLARLASKTVSPLIFAHVRASTDAPLADINCHPWSRGCLLWMHNGHIAGWNAGVKRQLVSDMGDRWFTMVLGGTDSEWAFACFLDTLDKMGYDPDRADLQSSGFGQMVLRKAMLRTIERINGYVKALDDTGLSPSLLNFAVADGHSVVCSRYINSREHEPATLFFSSGTSWQRQDPERVLPPGQKGEWKMERRDRGADIVLVASEPLTFERDNWVTVPTNSTITIHGQTVLIHPIVDEYHVPSPSNERSAALTKDKCHGIASSVPVPPMDSLTAAASRLSTAAAA